MSVNERIATLNSKMVLMKEKPGDFDLKAAACWEKGKKVRFIFLSLAFEISNETGRIVITMLCLICRGQSWIRPLRTW